MGFYVSFRRVLNVFLCVPQTGSGKTYTMGTGLEVDSLSGEVQGIVPRAVTHLFQGITQRREDAEEWVLAFYIIIIFFFEIIFYIINYFLLGSDFKSNS